MSLLALRLLLVWPSDTNGQCRRLCKALHNGQNYLFVGSDAGGERAAALYSLIGTAKLNGLDPEAYLREVLGRIADHPVNRVDELLPWRLMAQAEQRPALAECA